MDSFTPNRRVRTENALFAMFCVVMALVVGTAVLSLIFGW